MDIWSYKQMPIQTVALQSTPGKCYILRKTVPTVDFSPRDSFKSWNHLQSKEHFKNNFSARGPKTMQFPAFSNQVVKIL